VKKVRETLGNLPKTLDETYERILLSTNEEYRDIIVEALRWLCFSTRPMTMEQLAEAAVFSATVEPPSEEAPLNIAFDTDALFQDPLDILAFLSGLVVCLPPDYASGDDSDVFNDSDVFGGSDGAEHGRLESPSHIITATSYLLLSHFSVKEYLISDRLGPQVQAFAVDENSAHEVLATQCLYSMLFFQDERRSYPYNYAAFYWREHAREVDYESKLTHLIVTILEAKRKTRRPFLLGKSLGELEPDSLEPLYIAAYLDLYWPCKEMLHNGADANKQGGYYGNTLQAASEQGNQAIVHLLIDHGADVNKQGGYFGNGLQAASGNSNEAIVQLLIDNGADVNMQGGRYGNALQAASGHGSKSIVQLLLNHGANPNLRGGFNGSALQAGLWRPDRVGKSIVQLLLDHGAEVNTAPGFYDDDLNETIQNNNADAAVLLLEHGAVVYAFRGEKKAEEALERKDFRRFVAIQVEKLREEDEEWETGSEEFVKP
jgi:hypothetical protein